MRILSSPFTAVFAVASLLVALIPATVHAQQDPTNIAPMKDTLPIEVSLMYQKLSKITPDFHALMALNPNIKDDPTRFGNDVRVQQQYDSLKSIYDAFDENTVFLVKRRLTLIDVDSAMRTFGIVDLKPDEPFVFPLTDTDQYGIFLRNAQDLSILQAPFVFDQFQRLAGFRGNTFPAEIIVKPVLADSQPFPMPDGTMVKPIVADVVEITILAPDGQRVAAQKRFNNWEPGGTKPSLLDLKDNPLDHALVK